MKNENYDLMIGITGNRAPWINSEKIKQLKVYTRETEKKIAKMEKDVSVNRREIILEKQLLLSIRENLRDQERNAIDSEFFNRDYFPRI